MVVRVKSSLAGSHKQTLFRAATISVGPPCPSRAVDLPFAILWPKVSNILVPIPILLAIDATFDRFKGPVCPAKAVKVAAVVQSPLIPFNALII